MWVWLSVVKLLSIRTFSCIYKRWTVMFHDSRSFNTLRYIKDWFTSTPSVDFGLATRPGKCLAILAPIKPCLWQNQQMKLFPRIAQSRLNSRLLSFRSSIVLEPFCEAATEMLKIGFREGEFYDLLRLPLVTGFFVYLNVPPCCCTAVLVGSPCFKNMLQNLSLLYPSH